MPSPRSALGSRVTIKHFPEVGKSKVSLFRYLLLALNAALILYLIIFYLFFGRAYIVIYNAQMLRLNMFSQRDTRHVSLGIVMTEAKVHMYIRSTRHKGLNLMNYTFRVLNLLMMGLSNTIPLKINFSKGALLSCIFTHYKMDANSLRFP